MPAHDEYHPDFLMSGLVRTACINIFELMKRVAYIFTFLTLLFTAQPLIIRCQQMTEAKSACCIGSSCHKKGTEKKADNKDCDRTNSCNPFAGCSGCQYLAGGRIQYKYLDLLSASIRNGLYTERSVSGFSTDFWQPPESGLIL